MIHHGNSLDVLRTMRANSVHCVVTSPPYWSLRDYGVPPTVWGGNASCAHVWGDTLQQNVRGAVGDKSTIDGDQDRAGNGPQTLDQGRFCTACGAWLGCLGLEPAPELYVAHLVEIFDQVRRVLRRDGTLWLNLGDCYATNNFSGSAGPQTGLLAASDACSPRSKTRQRHQETDGKVPRAQKIGGLSEVKPKDLVGVPWMVAFALRGRGWYLRSDIIWSKTNPMPESIKDRPTKSHEYVFLLSKSDDYFYDADAIREGTTGTAHTRGTGLNPKAKNSLSGDKRRVGLNNRCKQNASFSVAVSGIVLSRNRRSVWTLPTEPFADAHFATFPKRLVEPCILAGTSAYGCCSTCGAPFERIIELGEELREQKIAGGCNADGEYHGKAQKDYARANAQDPSAVKARILAGMRERKTVGWKATCRCTLRSVVPCVVLDPFAGAATTGMVCDRTGRDFIGIDLNPEFVEMGTRRRADARRAAEASA